jgi:hypothetical protein
MSKMIGFALLAFVLLAAVPTFAVDGQVLISQATVIAAGGFPYKITQAGSYKLSGNLSVPVNINGIEINASNVTLDLNGFDISAPGVCEGSGKDLSCTDGIAGSGIAADNGVANIIVRNGSVHGFGVSGVEITLIVGSAIVEDINASNNRFGGINSGGIIRNCTADSNLGFGISGGGGVVENNVANNNGGPGISANLATVIGNEANNNGGNGLSVSQSIYGSNSFIGNNGGGADIGNSGGGASRSQNNNVCTGGTSC